ncbi:MAG: OstA-like protein, partial [Bacteroidota bacterium]
MSRILLIILLVILSGTMLHAQQPIKDTLSVGKIINIIQSERYNFQDLGDTTGKFISLVGNAKVNQGKTHFNADSIVLNQKSNIMEAFGNIHINDADSIHTYSQYVKYLGKEKKAYLN